MKTTKSSVRLDALITVLGGVGWIIFFSLYGRVFPAAALDLKLSRQEVQARAEAEARALGFDVDGYLSSLSFNESETGFYFLQHELGMDETNRLIREEGLPVWYWRARWFKPLQQEEFSLHLAPDGRVTGFSHTVKEDAPGAALAQEAARRLAEAYLAKKQGLRLDDWEAQSASSEDRPGGRRDHTFEWKRRNLNAGGGELRVSVGVTGDQVDQYDTWIRAPEAYLRRAEEQGNRADFLSDATYLAGMGLFSGVACSLIGLCLLGYRVPKPRAVWVALGVGVIVLFQIVNLLGLEKENYETTQQYFIFWLQILMWNAISVGWLVVAIGLVWAGGEQATGRVWPRQDKILPMEGNRWVTLARSTWRGLMAAGIDAGYVVLFYLIAVRVFGSWTPVGAQYSDVYATPFPFLAPITIGVYAAFLEESLYRLVGISAFIWFFERLLAWRKSWVWRFVAILIPGALWAFAHVSYVRDPFYLRGIEILIPAVLLYGLLYLRFDLTTTLVCHMTYNAMLGALPMLRAEEPYFVFSGVVVVVFLLAPMLPGLARVLLGRLLGWPDDPVPVIRPAKPGDLPALAALPVLPEPEASSAAAEDGERAEVEAQKRARWQELLDDAERQIFVLWAAEQPAGYAVGRKEGEAGWVETVYVDPRLRRKYYGSRLVEALLTGLTGQGATQHQAMVDAEGHSARGFLTSMDWWPKAYVFAPYDETADGTPGEPQRFWHKILQRIR